MTLLPHCLAKINRFAYGLLREDHRVADPHASRSRILAAVPFVGKDKPSPASEFAQPDITIGLTTLAYRYQGLRKSDVRKLLMYMLKRHHSQPGPAPLRPERMAFHRWVQAATTDFGTRFPDERCPEVPPLEHVQPQDDAVLHNVLTLLRWHAKAISYYISNVVFPRVTVSKPEKLSASGQALGTDMLFGVRLGYVAAFVAFGGAWQLITLPMLRLQLLWHAFRTASNGTGRTSHGRGVSREGGGGAH